jgi:hypothetical protein
MASRSMSAVAADVTLRLHLEPLQEGGYVATSPDVPGLVVEASTLIEIASLAQDLALEIARCCLDHSDPLPPVFRQPITSKMIELLVPVELP